MGKGGGPAVRAIPFSKGTGIVLHEGLKQNSTIVIVPSTAVETMQLGGLAGLATFSMGLAKKTKMAMRRNTGPQGPVRPLGDARLFEVRQALAKPEGG